MKVGLIGCGRMGGAILEGAVSKGIIDGTDVRLSSRSRESEQKWAKVLSAQIATNPQQVLQECDLVLIGCKPYQINELLQDLSPALPGDVALISIAAGVTLETMQQSCPPETRILRVMPNTPCMIGHGASGVSAGRFASETDKARTKKLFAAVGEVVEVSEDQLDAVTGLSGSGPAYVYRFVRELASQAEEEGLSAKDAHTLAVQTVLGAAQMLQQTGQTPQQLIDQVTSPGGTTLAGLEAMTETGFDHSTRAAVKAASHRSREIARGL